MDTTATLMASMLIGVFFGMVVMFGMFWPIRRCDLTVLRNLYLIIEEKDQIISQLKSCMVKQNIPMPPKDVTRAEIEEMLENADVDILQEVGRI